tara:strand:- start:687 stop:884 length:198 start_codon:yes stop_codon:yes gene_type:complete
MPWKLNNNISLNTIGLHGKVLVLDGGSNQRLLFIQNGKIHVPKLQDFLDDNAVPNKNKLFRCRLV